VVIATDGSITADGEPLGTVRMVRFADPRQLTAAGPTLYSAPPAAGLQNAPGRVVAGRAGRAPTCSRPTRWCG
jgi:flagellar basal-body rod protein FlgF/flagellar basal-body rod protein FlgG